MLAGIGAALSLPGFGLDVLCWFALVPLFFVLEGASYRWSFAYGLLAGIAFFGTLLHWLHTLRDWTGPAILPLYLLLILYLSLYWGAFGLLYTLLSRRLRTAWLALAVPALWVGLEFARALGKLGFTWGDLGYALYRRTELIQLAAVTGALGLSLSIVWVNFSLYLALKRRDWRPLASAVLVIALLLGYGMAVRPTEPEGRELRLAIVQPNIPQLVKSDPGGIEALTGRYMNLLAQLDLERAQLLILPESILPAYLLRQPEHLEPFRQFALETGVYLLFGTLDRREGEFYNTAALLSPQGELVATYDKVQLVPFSTEYLPLRSQLERLGLRRLIQSVAPADLTPGRVLSPLESPLGRIATPICFESTLPHISRGFVRKGAELLVTITNDAWFDRSLALEQHFAFGVLRAVESRRYFVQAANTGISGIISPSGRIITRSGIERDEILYGTVKLLGRRTFYTRFGDWVAHLSLLYLLIALITTALRVARAPRGCSQRLSR
jgi:apolipoprotein N-acyltransferase